MGDQTVRIDVEVNSNGTTDKEIKKAVELSSAYAKAQTAAKNTSAFKNAEAASSGAAGDSNYARGITGQTGAAGRDFAAQAQGLGGLVHVYATFAANVFAVSAAFTALSKAADFELMVRGMDQIGAAQGRNLGTMAKRLTEITDGAVSLKTALTATAQANAAGITADQLNRLAVVAATASHVLGRDLDESLHRLLLGVTKNQPKLLDELGILINVGKASRDYAASIGKSVTALTDFEKNQAFVNAAIKQGEAKFKDVTISANPYSKLLAEVTNLAYSAGAALNTVLGPISKFLGENPVALGTVLAAFTGLLISKAIPALTQWQDTLSKTAISSAESAKKMHASYEEFLISKDLGPGQALQRQADLHKNAVQQILAQNKGLFADNSKFTQRALGVEVNGKSFSQDDITSVKNKIYDLNTKIDSQQALYAEANKKRDAAQMDRIKQNIVSLEQLRNVYDNLAIQSQRFVDRQKEANNSFDAVIINADKNSKYLSEEAIRKRNLDSANLAATKAQIQSNVGQNTQNIGFSGATTLLKEDLAKTNFTPFQTAIAITRGYITAAATSVASFASSIGGVFQVVGVGIAVLGVLDSIFSKNSKEIELFTKSLQGVTDAVDGAQRTLDFYARNSVKAFSTEGIVAYANSFNEVSSAIQAVATSADKLKEKGLLNGDVSTSNFWEKSKDNIASLFGGGFQNNTAEVVGDALSKAITLAGTGPGAKKLQDMLQSILILKDTSAKGITDSIKGLSPEAFSATLATLAKKMPDIARIIGNNAAALKEYDDSAKTASEAHDKYLQSLNNNDPLFKFGSNIQTMSIKLTKALEDPQNAITAMINLSKDLVTLSYIPKDDAVKFAQLGKQLEIVEAGMIHLAKVKKDLNLEEGIAKDKKYLFQYANVPKENRGEFENKTIDAAQKDLDLKQAALRELDRQSLEKRNEGIKLINNAEQANIKLWIAGGEKIADALKQAAALADITYNKSVTAGGSGSGTADINAILAKEEISVQREMLESQKKNILATEGLRVTLENIELAAKIRDPATTTDMKARYASQLAQNQTIEKLIEENSLTKIEEFIIRTQKEVKAGAPSGPSIGALNALNTVKSGLSSYDSASYGLNSKGAAIEVIKQKEALKESFVEQTKLNQFAIQEGVIRLNTLKVLQGYSPIFDKELNGQIEATQLSQEGLAISQKQAELDEITGLKNIEISKLGNSPDKVKLLAAIEKRYGEQQTNKLIEIGLLEQQNYANGIALIGARMRLEATAAEYVASLKNRKADADAAIQIAKNDVIKNTLDILKNYGTISEAVYAKEAGALTAINDKLAFEATQRALILTQTKELTPLLIAQAEAQKQALYLPEGDVESAAGKALVSVNLALANVKSLQAAETNAANIKYESQQKILQANTVISIQTAQYNDLLKIQTGLVESLTVVFGTFGTTVGGVLTAFTEGMKRNQDLTMGYALQLKDIADKRAADIGGPGDDISATQAANKIKYDKMAADAKIKYDNQVAINEDTVLAKSANSIKKNFSEKTAAYKIFDAVEKAAHAAKLVRQGIEFAMTIKEMILNATKTTAAVAGDEIETASALAAVPVKQEDMLLSGGEAILSAIASMPFPLNLAAGAATAAFVAAIISGFGGGSAPTVSGASQKEIDAATASNVQTSQNRGGVLGDSTASSASIKNGIAELSKNSFSELDYTQSMLKSLQSIDKGISAFGIAIAKATGIQGVGPSKFGTVEGSSSSGSGGFLGIGKSSTTVATSILDTGIRLTGTIGDFLKGMGKVVQYEKDLIATTITKSGFLGIGGGTKTNNVITDQTTVLEDKTQKLFSNIITSMANSISEAFKGLQLPVTGLLGIISGIDVTGLSASLKGLSGQAATDAIDAFFSNIFDKMASATAPWIADFQKVGESLGDTLVRIASDTRTLNFEYELLGSTTLDAAKAAKAANITTEEWVKAQIKANEALIDLAGGLDQFVSKMDYISQNFLTESQKLAPVRKALADTFSSTGNLGKELAKLGLSTPNTRAEFVTLLTTLHNMGDAGNAATAALLDVAPAFNKIKGAIEDIIDSVGTRISDLEFQMTLDTLDTQGQYALINKTAGEDYAKYMAAVNDKAVSAVDAAKLANKLIDRIQSGWNLLTTEQRQEAGVREKYFSDLGEIKASLITKGGVELLGLSDDTIAQVTAIETSTDKIVAAITTTSETSALKTATVLSKTVISKAMGSSASELYGYDSSLSSGNIESLVEATLAAPTQIAAAMAANPPIILPIDVSGIQNSVNDLKDIVKNMLQILVDRGADPVNLNVNVQAPRNQEVGVSMA